MSRSLVLVAVCGVVCLSIASGGAVAAEPERKPEAPRATESRSEPDPMACASYDQANAGGGMNLSLKNQCAEALSCSIQWTLSCRSDRGRTVKREAASFDVAEGQTHAVEASAAACGTEASWKVADVRWTCKSATTPATARKREPPKGGSTRKTGR
jgi:hypothetical protein